VQCLCGAVPLDCSGAVPFQNGIHGKRGVIGLQLQDW
jgi:hypothetical protein